MKEDNTFELVEMLFNISRLMKGEMSYTNNLTHLSILQIQALIFFKQNKNIPMSEIAQHFNIELSSATSLLDKLYDLKLVKRQADLEDRRLVRINLTREGKKLLEQAMCQRRKKLEKFLSYLTKKEKSVLLDILKRLKERLSTK